MNKQYKAKNSSSNSSRRIPIIKGVVCTAEQQQANTRLANRSSLSEETILSYINQVKMQELPEEFHRLYDTQERALISAVRSDTIVALVTNSGKTLIFTLLAGVLNKIANATFVPRNDGLLQVYKIVVVITPLRELAKQHKHALLEKYNVKAECMDFYQSNRSQEDVKGLIDTLVENVQSGACTHLLITPKFFVLDTGQQLINGRLNVETMNTVIVIDEFHTAHQ